MPTEMFLTDAELVTLTGRKIKSLQIEALRKMGLTFWVNCAASVPAGEFMGPASGPPGAAPTPAG